MAIPFIDVETMAKWAYFAGFFDGEGYVGFTTLKAPASKKRVNRLINEDGTRRQILLRLGITNTDLAVLEELKTFVAAGGVYVHERKRKKEWKLTYVFATAKQSVIAGLLRGMLPFLRIKKQRAELALKWIESRECGKTRRPISDSEFSIFLTMRVLNKRGAQEITNGDTF